MLPLCCSLLLNLLLAPMLTTTLTTTQAFTMVPLPPTRATTNVAIHSTSISSPSSSALQTIASVEPQTFFLDGGESDGDTPLVVTIGTAKRKSAQNDGGDQDGDLLVGILESDGDGEDAFLPDSVARVPPNVSPSDARCTYRAALAICDAVPILDRVGGDPDHVILPDSFRSVVLGSNELAVFAGHALAVLGGDVHVVTSSSVAKVEKKIKKEFKGQVAVVKPSMGVNDTGFADAIGQFDSIVDTLHDERAKSSSFRENEFDYDDEDDDDEEDEDSDFKYSPPPPSVLQLLSSRHGCHRYVSTLSESQRIVGSEGVMFGPGKTNDYASKKQSAVSTTKSMERAPTRIGYIVETLLDAGVTMTSATWKPHPKNPTLRGWSLADFWEQTTWPRDSSSTSSSVRFGLPTRSEFTFDENEDESMVSAPPLRRGGLREAMTSQYAQKIEIGSIETADEREAMEAERKRLTSTSSDNPFVLDVIGVRGLRTEIVDPKLDCVLFLSARFCKTCKTLTPQYNRLARLESLEESSPSSSKIIFARGEASGRLGRQLGQELGVLAVPSFLLFRKGRRFGPPLSLSRLPSTKFDRAIELLRSGAEEWEEAGDRDDDEEAEARSKQTRL